MESIPQFAYIVLALAVLAGAYFNIIWGSGVRA